MRTQLLRRFVPVWRGQNLIATGDGAEPRAVFLTPDEAAIADAVLLCVLEGCAYFAVDLSAIETPTEAIGTDPSAQFLDLRRVGPLLPRVEGAMLAIGDGALGFWGALLLAPPLTAIIARPRRPQIINARCMRSTRISICVGSWPRTIVASASSTT